MSSITLNNGVLLPVLGLGTYRLRNKEVVKSIVKAAINFGYRLIDTASVYNNEEFIGECLKEMDGTLSREDIFITSKLGPAQQGWQKAREALTKSLNDLQTPYLDLYLIHWPGCAGLHSDSLQHASLRKESWIELEKMYKEGKIKAIGVSNYTINHLKELMTYCTVVPAILQVEVHPYLCQKELREFCKEHGIHVQAYSSLGAATGCQQLMCDGTVKQIAAHHNKSPAQVLLKWAIQHDLSVIPKTSHIEHLKENKNIFDFSLTDKEMERLDTLDKDYHFCWDPNSIC